MRLTARRDRESRDLDLLAELDKISRRRRNEEEAYRLLLQDKREEGEREPLKIMRFPALFLTPAPAPTAFEELDPFKQIRIGREEEKEEKTNKKDEQEADQEKEKKKQQQQLNHFDFTILFPPPLRLEVPLRGIELAWLPYLSVTMEDIPKELKWSFQFCKTHLLLTILSSPMPPTTNLVWICNLSILGRVIPQTTFKLLVTFSLTKSVLRLPAPAPFQEAGGTAIEYIKITETELQCADLHRHYHVELKDQAKWNISRWQMDEAVPALDQTAHGESFLWSSLTGRGVSQAKDLKEIGKQPRIALEPDYFVCDIKCLKDGCFLTFGPYGTSSEVDLWDREGKKLNTWRHRVDSGEYGLQHEVCLATWRCYIYDRCPKAKSSLSVYDIKEGKLIASWCLLDVFHLPAVVGTQFWLGKGNRLYFYISNLQSIFVTTEMGEPVTVLKLQDKCHWQCPLGFNQAKDKLYFLSENKQQILQFVLPVLPGAAPKPKNKKRQKRKRQRKRGRSAKAKGCQNQDPL